jgi:putative transposase
MLRVVKVRIYPDSSQKLALAKGFGSCRWDTQLTPLTVVK